MTIHCMQVRCNEVFYDVWMIDDDTTNIISLHEAIEEDLKCLKKDPTTSFDITARIRGGEKLVAVNSDATMMQMFNLNSNPSDVILLDVKIVKNRLLAMLQQVERQMGGNSEVEKEVGGDEVGHNEGDRDQEVESDGDDRDDEVDSDEVPDNEVDGDEVPNNEVDGDAEIKSDDDDDIRDPECKYRRDYSEDEASNDFIGDKVVSSDDEIQSDADAEKNVRRRPLSDEDEIDPMSNIPDARSHIGPDRKINLKLWQVFDDHNSFDDVLLEFCIQEGFEMKKKNLTV